jgi:aconitate hydratase
MTNNPFNTLQTFDAGGGRTGYLHSLPSLEKQGVGPISRLPVSIRIVLESVLRNCDGKRVSEKDVHTLANWSAKSPANEEIPFVVARIVLQDFTGVPLLVDLAAMRSAVARLGRDAKMIEPLVPVDLVVDHSVQVDFYGSSQALLLNMDLEFKRNRERYELLKWGQQAYKTFGVVPPGIGIVHQVNLEYLAKGVLSAPIADGTLYYPDTLVGTDSHTTMINGLGVVGWGVGGIEAEAGMLGQPVYFLTPEVVGVHLSGALREGVTATDLVLHITQMLRAKKVVGKFVEFYGPGAKSLAVTDRATIGNMAPEYGATMGFFPIDEETVWYLRATGRTEEQVSAFENYFKAQGLFGIPDRGEIDYSVNLDLDLSVVHPSVSGPKRPQDRIELPALKETFINLLHKSVPDGGYGKPDAVTTEKFPVHLNGKKKNEEPAMASSDSKPTAPGGEPMNKIEMISNRPTPDLVEDMPVSPFPVADIDLAHGTVLIAAITSCTNTSNPSVMLGAGLLAKKAVERGMHVNPAVKTSLGPGSRVVSEYLNSTGLQPFLDQLGFQVVGYGCTTCIGNSGPLNRTIEDSITEHDLVTAAVLSGNRNFEARIHQNIKANFLMSPPLVVAFALAGRVDIDMATDPIGKDRNGVDVYLKDLWPTLEEVRGLMKSALSPELFRRLYSDFAGQNPKWNEIPSKTGDVYQWDTGSNYIAEPPFFAEFSMQPAPTTSITDARPLGIFGDSVTTDHISPAGAIKASSPAGKYLVSRGVEPDDFNSYGSRRGNDHVMTRGTFANVRIKNLMVPGIEGGVTKHYPDATQMPIYDASVKYQADGVPLVILAGLEYGTGSSRDWAAKGTRLLGVRAVVAASFERIHRSNLVGMGVLPLQFAEGTDAKSLSLDGSETYSFTGIDELAPGKTVFMTIKRANGATESVPLRLRIDTAVEVDYYKHGGILPYVLRQILAAAS